MRSLTPASKEVIDLEHKLGEAWAEQDLLRARIRELEQVIERLSEANRELKLDVLYEREKRFAAEGG